MASRGQWVLPSQGPSLPRILSALGTENAIYLGLGFISVWKMVFDRS